MRGSYKIFMKKLITIFICFGVGIIAGIFLEKNIVLNNDKQVLNKEDLERATMIDKAITSCNEFLNGEKSVDGIDMDFIISPKGEKDKHYATKYAFWDSNSDNVPELHINSARYYYVFSYVNGEMKIFKDLSPYPYYYALNNGGFISYRPGAAPDSDEYNYLIYNYLGNEILNISFAKYDLNENGIYDSGDEYFYDGVKVTKEIWEKLTERFLYTDIVGIEEIRNEISWIILYEED